MNKFCLLLLVCSSLALAEGKCPAAKSIAPCTCNLVGGINIICDGMMNNITQVEVNNALKAAVKIPTLHTFALMHTMMTRLDLTAFSGLTCQFVNITDNWAMHTIDAHGVANGKIKAQGLRLEGSSLTDYGLRDTLLKFDTSSLILLSLFQNKVVGSQLRVTDKMTNSGFLPGLAAFSNLEYLSLEFNSITAIAGGQFRKNNKLKVLALDMNHLEEIGEDAFVFEDNPKSKNDLLTINLSHNWLNDDKISIKSGLDRINRPVKLDMWGNNFEYLSKEKFHPFLMKNKLNSIEFGDIHPPMPWGDHMGWGEVHPEEGGAAATTAATPTDTSHVSAEHHEHVIADSEMYFSNWPTPFACADPRMAWLKKEKAAFASRVFNVTCMDNPPNNIFNTTLA